MAKCVNHPDRETDFVCMKYDVYLCEKCLECSDHETYCKFRTSCLIWLFTTENTERAD